MSEYKLTREVWFKAADIIAEGGLHKGSYYYFDKCCTVGAICKALGHRPEEDGLRLTESIHVKAAIAFRAFSGEAMGDNDVDAVPTWNDAEERTQEDVVRVLRKIGEAL